MSAFGVYPMSLTNQGVNDMDNDLGQFDQAWEGFVIRGGIIYTPASYPVRPGDLNCIPIRLQQIANYERMLETPQQLLL